MACRRRIRAYERHPIIYVRRPETEPGELWVCVMVGSDQYIWSEPGPPATRPCYQAYRPLFLRLVYGALVLACLWHLGLNESSPDLPAGWSNSPASPATCTSVTCPLTPTPTTTNRGRTRYLSIVVNATRAHLVTEAHMVHLHIALTTHLTCCSTISFVCHHHLDAEADLPATLAGKHRLPYCLWRTSTAAPNTTSTLVVISSPHALRLSGDETVVIEHRRAPYDHRVRVTRRQHAGLYSHEGRVRIEAHGRDALVLQLLMTELALLNYSHTETESGGFPSSPSVS